MSPLVNQWGNGDIGNSTFGDIKFVTSFDKALFLLIPLDSFYNITSSADVYPLSWNVQASTKEKFRVIASSKASYIQGIHYLAIGY